MACTASPGCAAATSTARRGTTPVAAANKQRVFDDFHAAADWLVAQGYTPRDLLALHGGSNGGLLMGAAITQRPDLAPAVWCAVPLLDMIRFPQFLIARLWTDEYGDPDVDEEFGWLHAYSPYHHVHEGGAYPAVLFTTAEGDTRVDPCHARKMAARSPRRAPSQAERPILLSQAGRAGHGVGKPAGMRVNEGADVLAFFCWQLGVEHLRMTAVGELRHRVAGRAVGGASGSTSIDGVARIGGIALRFVPRPTVGRERAVVGWGLRPARPTRAADGASTAWPPPRSHAPPRGPPPAITRWASSASTIVVVMTSSLERTCGAIEAATGEPLKRDPRGRRHPPGLPSARRADRRGGRVTAGHGADGLVLGLRVERGRPARRVRSTRPRPGLAAEGRGAAGPVHRHRPQPRPGSGCRLP